MIYLNEGLLKPMVVLISVIFCPILSLCVIGLILEKRLEFLVLSCVIFICLLATFWGIYKYSKNTKYYLYFEGEQIFIKYPNVAPSVQEATINCTSIIRIEYYKMSSIKSWCMLYNYVCPQCVYVVYLREGKELCRHIGYMDYTRIRNLCDRLNIALVVK